MSLWELFTVRHLIQKRFILTLHVMSDEGKSNPGSGVEGSQAGSEKPQSNPGSSAGAKSNAGASSNPGPSGGPKSNAESSAAAKSNAGSTAGPKSNAGTSSNGASSAGPKSNAAGSSGGPKSNTAAESGGGTPKTSAATGESGSKKASQAGSQAPASGAGGTAQSGQASEGGSTNGEDKKGHKKRMKGEKVTLRTARIGFLGAGKIADAMVRGMIRHTKLSPKLIHVSSKSGKMLDSFRSQGCHTSKRFYDIFGKFDCDIIIVALHGYAVRECYKMGGSRPMALTTNYIPNQRHPLFVLSVVGGVSVVDLKNTLLNPEHPEKYIIELHRCMVNCSVAYGIGVSAIDVEPDSKKCNPMLRDLLTSFSKVEYTPEAQMDVCCAVGGNGLAFAYYFLTALSDGGFKMGLPKNMAVKLAAKVLQSASACLLESDKHPSELRDRCVSPSGPAIYGIHVLDQKDCSSGIASAVEAAYKRIKELAEQPNNSI